MKSITTLKTSKKLVLALIATAVSASFSAGAFAADAVWIMPAPVQNTAFTPIPVVAIPADSCNGDAACLNAFNRSNDYSTSLYLVNAQDTHNLMVLTPALINGVNSRIDNLVSNVNVAFANLQVAGPVDLTKAYSYTDAKAAEARAYTDSRFVSLENDTNRAAAAAAALNFNLPSLSAGEKACGLGAANYRSKNSVSFKCGYQAYNGFNFSGGASTGGNSALVTLSAATKF